MLHKVDDEAEGDDEVEVDGFKDFGFEEVEEVGFGHLSTPKRISDSFVIASKARRKFGSLANFPKSLSV